MLLKRESVLTVWGSAARSITATPLCLLEAAKSWKTRWTAFDFLTFKALPVPQTNSAVRELRPVAVIASTSFLASCLTAYLTDRSHSPTKQLVEDAVLRTVQA